MAKVFPPDRHEELLPSNASNDSKAATSRQLLQILHRMLKVHHSVTATPTFSNITQLAINHLRRACPPKPLNLTMRFEVRFASCLYRLDDTPR